MLASWPWPLELELLEPALFNDARGFLAFRFCAVSFSRRRSTAVSATRAAPAWGLGSPGPWPPRTPHGQAPTPYLYKTPPKNISDPKNSRVTDPKIPEVSAWRAMADALLCSNFQWAGC